MNLNLHVSLFYCEHLSHVYLCSNSEMKFSLKWQNQNGILAMLDEECLRPGAVTDDTFLEKLNQVCATHQHFESRMSKCSRFLNDTSLPHCCFRIQHYAGKVTSSKNRPFHFYLYCLYSILTVLILDKWKYGCRKKYLRKVHRMGYVYMWENQIRPAAILSTEELNHSQREHCSQCKLLGSKGRQSMCKKWAKNESLIRWVWIFGWWKCFFFFFILGLSFRWCTK